ncbi:chaperone HSP70 [Blastocystis sp. subtype 4]|uniref:chaperone HSP70 n=1 Tax=Blastocystis sp. subtype 4 TaxID=944170 RepID=UPI00071178DA|nr:chaperone HSP70 [Blastocystis sp. subtype 4]KNB41700.1 chaperone HSP70 [Blastocystis sp. subtype 4]|eukprot:XP_014525143.1 chaperone HSP70 [Blastocystis sp. subtype 4]
MTVNYDNIPIGYAYPEYINALFLSYLVNFASEKIDMEIKDVVITVPAFFSAVQLHATLQTTRLAGLNWNNLSLCLVYDLGGGIFDIILIEIKNGDYRVIKTEGNHSLGGSDFDYLLAEYLQNELETYGIYIEKTSRKYQRLVHGAEKAKIALSIAKSTDVPLSSFATVASEVDDYYTIDRSKFEELIREKLDQS